MLKNGGPWPGSLDYCRLKPSALGGVRCLGDELGQDAGVDGLEPERAVQLAHLFGRPDARQNAAIEHVGGAQIARHRAIQRDLASDARHGVEHQAQEPRPFAVGRGFAGAERGAVDGRGGAGVTADLGQSLAPQRDALGEGR